MGTLARPVRIVLLGAAAIAAGPAVVLSGGDVDATVAQPCTGGVNVVIMQHGAPVSAPCPGPIPVGTTGGAPSQEILSWCSGIPGCLSSVYYGPGNVQVPQRDTKVRQSQ